MHVGSGHFGDARAKAFISRQEVDSDGLGPEAQGGREDHFAAPAAQVVKVLALLQAGQTADLQSREIWGFTEAEIAEWPVRQGFSLQVDVQGQETPKVEDPHESFYLD